MGVISYAQNFEDVLLQRALRDVGIGSYLDIGAQDPVVDSVSFAFYQMGWRGIHVEPTPSYAARLRSERPDEIVIQAAVTDKVGPVRIFEIAETGLSTGDADIAAMHSEMGHSPRPLFVPSIRLDQILEMFDSDIQWLKIDVEGMEREVLASWGHSPIRPWVLVIEAMHPNSQSPTHHSWSREVRSRGYREVHFDGLSRFFVHETHAELGKYFASPPNVFDGFSIAAPHFAAGEITRAFNDQLAAAGSEAARRVEELNRTLNDARERAEASASDAAIAVAERDAERQNAAIANMQLENAAREGQLALEFLTVERDRALEEVRVAGERLVTAVREHREAVVQLIRDHRATLHGAMAEASAIRAAALGQRNAAEHEHHAELSTITLERDEARAKSEHLLSTAQRAEAMLRSVLSERSGWWREISGLLTNSRGRREWRQLASASLLLTGIGPTTHHTRQPAGEREPVPSSFVRLATRNPYLRAGSLLELLSWHEVDFIRCAYVTILGRQPDPEGEAFYLARIQTGISKLTVLSQLRCSDEGRTHDPGIAGLDRELRRHRNAIRPFVGWVVRAITSREGDSQSERENRIFQTSLRHIEEEKAFDR